MTVLVAGLIGFSSLTALGQRIIALDWKAPTAAYLVVAALAFPLAIHNKRSVAITSTSWMLAAIECFLLQLFCMVLVNASGTAIGAAIFACLYFFTVVSHGSIHRTTLSEPILLLGSIPIGIYGLVAAPSDAHVAILGVIVPASMLGQVLLGTRALAGDRSRRERDMLRAAVQAQIEDDHARLSARLADVMGANHDLGNAIAVASLSTRVLRTTIRRAEGGTLAASEITGRVEQLEASISRVQQIIESSRRARQGKAEDPEARAPLPDVVSQVLASAGDRFPRIQFVSSLDAAVEQVRMNGGGITLHRVLENLVINACEGDAVRRASQVEVEVQAAPGLGEVVVTVRDDGPGFRPEQLARAITGFDTTKPHGTGLGLYTSERLVRASGGSLERRNRPAGGAEVQLRLPLGSPAASETERAA